MLELTFYCYKFKWN